MTNVFNLQRILLSLGVIVFVGAIVASATGAFFNDTETSTGNTFAAGALDLKVDSQSHYNGLVCEEVTAGVFQWQVPEGGDPVGPDHYPQPGMPCSGTWAESDLIPDSLAFRFFNFNDIKPGDEGENTISLHVYDNDAWGCFIVDNVSDLDVTCTEPESESTDPECSVDINSPGAGELGGVITFDAWLDEGQVPGFQCNDPSDEDTAGAACEADPLEGDNVLNGVEQLFWTDETVDEASEGPFAMSEILSAAYGIHQCDVATGNTEYGVCHGLAEDGRMVGSTTYYWGLAWNVPDTAGNEIQTDELVMDMIFEVEQHRNNSEFQCTPPTEPTTFLTLAKAVLPPAVALDTDFTLIADGPTDLSGVEGTAAVTLVPVTPGIYALSETGGPGGETSIIWECSGNATPEVDNGNGTATVTIAEGESVVCGVTNNYPEID
jgi:predicted ribosomally synthesized peptide with SipW-like signal peptide